MAYIKTIWENDKLPAINATNLNNMENAIEEAFNVSESILNVGDVYVTSTNINPSERLGGTWELIDKEFKSENTNSNSFFNANTSNCNVSGVYITRAGHNINVRFNFNNNTALSDNTIALGSFDFAELGITGLPYGLYYVIGSTDDGNGIFMTFVDYQNGTTEVRDVITKTSGGTIASGSSCYLLFELTTTYDRMLDDFCDKFYWKKTM